MTKQTAMAAALAKAGIVGPSRLMIAADEAMAKCHGNVERAAAALLKEIGKTELLNELAVYYVRNYRIPGADQISPETQRSFVDTRNVNGGQRHRDYQESTAADANGGGQTPFANQPGAATPVREPSAAQNAAQLAVKTKIALNVFDREKTITGRPWGNVHYLELAAMAEDGELAAVVRAHIGQLLGADRQKQVRDLMTPREFHACLRKIGRQAHA